MPYQRQAYYPQASQPYPTAYNHQNQHQFHHHHHHQQQQQQQQNQLYCCENTTYSPYRPTTNIDNCMPRYATPTAAYPTG